MDLRGVTLEMFMDKEELRELRIGETDSDEPGRCQQQKHQQSLEYVQMLPQCPVTLPDAVEHNSARRQHQGNQALGQHRQGQ